MEISEELLLGSSNTPNLSWLTYWNYTTGNVVHMHRNKCKPVKNTLHQLANNYILIADEEKPMLHMWAINRQEECKERYILPAIATAVSVDPESKYLAVGIGPMVYLWNIPSGTLLNIIQKHYQPISAIKMTREHLIIGGKDGMLVTYRLHTIHTLIKTRECNPLYTKNDHTGPITDITVGVFGDKSNIATVSQDSTCRIYTLQTGVPLIVLAFNDALTCVLFDITSRFVFVGEKNGIIRNIFLQNASSLTQHVDAKLPCFRGHTASVSCLTLNSTNGVLASASEDSTIIVWSVESREQIRKIQLEMPARALLFVNQHVNINEQNLRPEIMVRPLQKAIVGDPEDVEMYVMQRDDIRFSDDDDSDGENDFKEVGYQPEEDFGETAKENERLRAANCQLFDTLVKISRKYNSGG